MELNEAVRKAAQILNEEKSRPTVAYRPSVGDSLAAGIHAMNLYSERQERPRPVHESPNEFEFKSVNYELLLALYSQVQPSSRADFVAVLLSRISNSTSPKSESPLLGEFCIRAGYKEELIRFIGESQPTLGLMLLLRQLEDTIALNFNLFSDEELDRLATALKNVRAFSHRKAYEFSRQRYSSEPRVRNPEYNATVAPLAKEIVAFCDGLVEECRQARYWYLKGALQRSANLEVNLDKSRVEGYLTSLGFSGPLLEALNAAEQDFRESATPFELKNCLGHLRSFLEGLHEQACRPIAAKAGTPPPTRWGKTTEMLRSNAILSQPEEDFATSLYTLISDEGVHPLIAEREYARLLRNVVIEYGLMFLAKLEKAGISVR